MMVCVDLTPGARQPVFQFPAQPDGPAAARRGDVEAIPRAPPIHRRPRFVCGLLMRANTPGV